MNRRDFLRTACAAAAAQGLPLRLWGAGEMLEAPDLTIGVLSDIHVSLGPKDAPVAATRLFRHALEYFRDRHVDGVMVTGDLANAGLETELKAVADAWFSVFPNGRLPDGSQVANLMLYGDHDTEARFYTDGLKARFAKAGVPVPRSLSQDELRRECWEKFFGEAWSPVRHVKVKGYDFVLSNFMREGGRSAPDDLARLLAEMKLEPRRPFFYGQHRYIGGTYLADEEMWGEDNGVAGKVLPAYPNCVAFQGHTHYMLTDDRGVWVGPYVTVNAGALLNAGCGRVRENGVDISWYRNDYMRDKQMRVVKPGQGHGGMLMRVKGDLVCISRRDFGCDRPLGPDIVFSTDPALRARYANAARKAASVAPEFPAGARVKIGIRRGADRQGRATEQVVVTFPTVKARGAHPRAHEYLVRAARADGTVLCDKRVYSPGINLPDELDAAESVCVFARRELGTGGEIRFTVAPWNCWGVAGEPVGADFRLG